MTSGISLHIIHDAIYQQLPALYATLDSIRPRVVNVVGGARKNEAFALAVELLKRYPAMRVIYRSYPDDGNHALVKYKLITHRDTFGNLILDDASGAFRWIADNEAALRAGLTVLTDNESVRDDMDVYALWQSVIMDECAKHGWKVAVGRFAVGNPREADYSRMATMWRSLARHHPLHTWSPNEYLPPNLADAGGMLGRYKLGIAAAKAIGAWPFDVSIGEYAVVYRHGGGTLDADAGYKDSRIGWSGKQAARFLINQWKTTYKPDGVDCAVYCYGDSDGGRWSRFRVDNDGGFMDELKQAAQSGELEPIPMAVKPLPTVPEPSNKGEGQPITIEIKQNYTHINLRTLPSTTGTDIGNIVRGEKGVIYPSSITSDGGYNWYWFERNVTPSGEGSKGWITYKMPVISIPLPPDTPPQPEPEPETPPAPPPPMPAPYVEITSEKARAIGASYEALYKAMEKTIAAEMEVVKEYKSLAVIWRAIADDTAKPVTVTKEAA